MEHKLTSQQVIDFAKYLFDYYSLKPKDKRKSLLMKVVAWFLEKINYMSKEKFLKHFTVVILGRVYLPFTIGNNEERWLPSQISTIAHECQHAVQKRKNKRYNLEYMFNTSKRALYEAEAYRVNMELHFWYTGKVLSSVVLSNKLFDYGCKTIDVAMTKITLDRYASLIKDGIIISEASKIALGFLSREFKKGDGQPMSEKYYSNIN